MDDVARLAVALGIGLLLGVERERRKGRGPKRGPAGVRTFALVALLGGVARLTGGTALLAVTATFVGLAAVAAFNGRDSDDPGITTEVAFMVAFLLGALAQDRPGLAAGAAVAVALLLAHRERLHRLVRDTLSEDEVHDGLLFAAAALIVLPLLPDAGYGPGDALNPVVVWRLVVIVMAVQAAGYVALRAVGPRAGLLLSGLISGFVSSTATVASMGARARKEPSLLRATVAAAVVSTVATVGLLAVVVGATSASTLRHVALELALAGAMAAAYAALVAWRLAGRRVAPTDPGRAFDLRIALGLAVAVTAVMLAAGALEDALGPRGATLAAAVGGFADSQSAAASAASLVAAGQLSPAEAVIPVLAALTTNSISKLVVASALGRRRFAIEVGVGLALVVGAAWAGYGLDTLS